MASEAVYQTKSGAASAASARAQRLSPRGACEHVAFTGRDYLSTVVRPVGVENAPGFAVVMLMEGWAIETLTPEQIVKRQEAGRRQARAAIEERIQHAEARARELLGSKFAARHVNEAERLRREAAQLEAAPEVA